MQAQLANPQSKLKNVASVLQLPSRRSSGVGFPLILWETSMTMVYDQRRSQVVTLRYVLSGLKTF